MGCSPTGRRFLDDFQRHWPTDEDHTYVDFVRDGIRGNGAARMGNARWRRLTEERAGGAKSVFHFDVQGSVAKSTHAGIPWLRFIRQRLGDRVHFWPFDGWDIPAGRSAIAEVYPALWSRGFANEDRTGDQHDAFSIAAWLSRADRDGSLAAFLKPDLRRPNARWRRWRAGFWALRTRPIGRSRVAVRRAEAPTVAPLPTPKRAGSRIRKACPECGYAFRGGTWGALWGRQSCLQPPFRRLFGQTRNPRSESTAPAPSRRQPGLVAPLPTSPAPPPPEYSHRAPAY